MCSDTRGEKNSEVLLQSAAPFSRSKIFPEAFRRGIAPRPAFAPPSGYAEAVRRSWNHRAPHGPKRRSPFPPHGPPHRPTGPLHVRGRRGPYAHGAPGRPSRIPTVLGVGARRAHPARPARHSRLLPRAGLSGARLAPRLLARCAGPLHPDGVGHVRGPGAGGPRGPVRSRHRRDDRPLRDGPVQRRAHVPPRGHARG